MYLTRLGFQTLPGKTHQLEQQLEMLTEMVQNAGGDGCRILRAHYASPGAPDVLFEQEAPDLQSLEAQIKQVAETPAFREWSNGVSPLLREPPKREIFIIRG